MYQKHRSCNLNLALRPKYRDDVGSGLLVRETDARVGLRLNVTNENALLAQ